MTEQEFNKILRLQDALGRIKNAWEHDPDSIPMLIDKYLQGGDNE